MIYRLRKMLARRRKSLSPTAELDKAMKLQGLEPDVVRSLHLMLVSNIMGVICGNICGTASSPMIGMANDLGAGDLVFGILNAVPHVAVLLQIPCAMLVGWTHKRKKYLLTFGVISRALWLIIGLIPIIMPDKVADLRVWAILFLVGMANCLGSFIQVCWFPWLGDLTPISIRGLWISSRDSINAIVSVLSGLLTGWMMDHISAPARYIALFTIGSVAGIVDMILYAFCKEVYTSEPVKPSFKNLGWDLFKNKNFTRFLIFWTSVCFCGNFAGAYLSRYSVNEMGITYTQITLFGGITNSLVTMVAVRFWGHMVIRYGTKPVLWISAIGSSLVQLIYLTSRPGSVIPIILYNAVGAIFWSANNLVSSQIQLSFTNDENGANSIAIFACFTSIIGNFLGIMAGGTLLEALNGRTIPLGLDRYQLAIIIAVSLRFMAVFLSIPKMENERNFTVKTMIRDLLRSL